MRDEHDDYCIKKVRQETGRTLLALIPKLATRASVDMTGLEITTPPRRPRIPACQNACRKSSKSCYAGRQEESSHRLYEVS